MEQFKIGDRVQHKDGTRGEVIRVDGDLIEWRYAGQYRASNASVLRNTAGDPLPSWRRSIPNVAP